MERAQRSCAFRQQSRHGQQSSQARLLSSGWEKLSSPDAKEEQVKDENPSKDEEILRKIALKVRLQRRLEEPARRAKEDAADKIAATFRMYLA